MFQLIWNDWLFFLKFSDFESVQKNGWEHVGMFEDIRSSNSDLEDSDYYFSLWWQCQQGQHLCEWEACQRDWTMAVKGTGAGVTSCQSVSQLGEQRERWVSTGSQISADWWTGDRPQSKFKVSASKTNFRAISLKHNVSYTRRNVLHFKTPEMLFTKCWALFLLSALKK